MNYLGNGSHERGNYIMFPQKYFFRVKCVNSFSFDHTIYLFIRDQLLPIERRCYIAVLMHIRINVNAVRNAFLKKSPIKRLFKECPPPEGLLHFTIRGLIEMH